MPEPVLKKVEAEFSAWLDEYIAGWTKALRQGLAERERMHESCDPNQSGPGHHDSETGHPCSPGGKEATAPDPEEHAKGWLARAREIPAKVYAKARLKVSEKYSQLESRYGRKLALAIMGAGLAGVPIPLPGSVLMTAAPVIAAAEVYRRLAGAGARPVKEAAPELSPEEVGRLGREWMKEILDEFARELKGSR